jgi:hypothetical protein
LGPWLRHRAQTNVVLIISRIFIFVAIFAICSCEKLAGPESREVAGGYRLKRVRGSNSYALIVPHGTGGMIVDEIGWREPLIVARSSGSQYWEVINIARAEHTWVSDETMKSDAAYKAVEINTADKAWAELKPDSKIW